MLRRNPNLKLCISFVACCCLFFSLTLGWNKQLFKGGDQWGYNAYLVSICIYGDLLRLDKTYEAKCAAYNLYAAPRNQKNRIAEAPDGLADYRVLKYSYGVALLQSPFFLVVHLINQGTGYGKWYVLAVYLSSYVYLLLGCILLLQVLQQFVSYRFSIIAILLTLLASNLFYFAFCYPGMSHLYLFFLFTWLLYNTLKFISAPTWKLAAILGFIMGLILVSRPVDIIVACIPFILLANGKNLKKDFNFIRHFKMLLMMIVIIILVALPQLIYWKITSGHWIYDSYPGEHFDFSHPNLAKGLFSFKNGWLTYTPIMLIPVIYLAFRARVRHRLLFAIGVYLIIHLYITYSWTQWNYSPGLGSRTMVETYAILCLPLAMAIQTLLSGRISKYGTWIFLFGCLYLNLLRTVQMQTGNFISEDATVEFNRRMTFKLTTTLEDLYAFDIDQSQPNMQSLTKIKEIGRQDFDSTTAMPHDGSFESKAGKAAFFSTENEFNNPLQYMIDTSVNQSSYFRVSAYCRADAATEYYKMGRLVLTIERNGQSIFWKGIRINNKLTDSQSHASLFGGLIGTWRPISYFIRADINIEKGDQVKVYGWNPFRTIFALDHLVADWYIAR